MHRGLKEFPARAVKGAAWKMTWLFGSQMFKDIIANLNQKKKHAVLTRILWCEIISIQHGTDCRLSQTGMAQRIQKGHHWV